MIPLESLQSNATKEFHQLLSTLDTAWFETKPFTNCAQEIALTSPQIVFALSMSF